MKLQEMTLQQLWELFPILLTEHNPGWKEWFRDEKALLESILRCYANLRITHIGSTAIPGIMAKPIVDILLEMPKGTDMKALAATLEENGWIIMSHTQTRISLNKGYTPQGYAERVFHLHLRYNGDNAEIIFRDYLRSHPFAAQEYEALKIALWKEYGHDRDAYTAGKTLFVGKFSRPTC